MIGKYVIVLVHWAYWLRLHIFGPNKISPNTYPLLHSSSFGKATGVHTQEVPMIWRDFLIKGPRTFLRWTWRGKHNNGLQFVNLADTPVVMLHLILVTNGHRGLRGSSHMVHIDQSEIIQDFWSLPPLTIKEGAFSCLGSSPIFFSSRFVLPLPSPSQITNIPLFLYFLLLFSYRESFREVPNIFGHPYPLFLYFQVGLSILFSCFFSYLDRF